MTRGFLLNNELTDFSFTPETEGAPVANRVEAGKRSSMAPTMVLKDGVPILLTGGPGGANIIDYTVLSIIAMLDWEMDSTFSYRSAACHQSERCDACGGGRGLSGHERWAHRLGT